MNTLKRKDSVHLQRIELGCSWNTDSFVNIFVASFIGKLGVLKFGVANDDTSIDF